MKRIFTFLISCFLTITAIKSQDLIITGVVDGTLSGGTPKLIELYVVNDITDLSSYGFGSANNGGGSDGQEVTLSGSASQGDFIYIATEVANFNTFFGFNPDFTAGAASINGDDAIELFLNGAVIDVFGDINTDGSGQSWDYLDGWAYRNSNTGPDGNTFVENNWSFSGINALDGASDNASSGNPFPIGTFSLITAPQLSVSGTTAAVAETGTTSTIDVFLTDLPSSDVVVTISSSDIGEATVSPTSLTFTSANGTTPQTITITGIDDTDADGNQSVTVSIEVDDANSDDTFDGQSHDVLVTVADDDGGTSYDLISTVQTSGNAVVAGNYTIRGIVTAVFDDLDGFYVQEEDSDWDANPNTSEGIFVYTGASSTPSSTVSVGDDVEVSGTAEEAFDQSQLTNPTVTVLGNGLPLPTKPTIALPLAAVTDLEKYEGMLIEITANTGGLTVNNVFNLGRFGETVVSTGGQLDGRWLQYTQVNTPSTASYSAYETQIENSTIIIDDGRTGSNSFPVFYARGGGDLTPTNTLRGGDKISSITGIMGYGFGEYRVQPTEPVNYQAVNERPTAAPSVGGDLKVGSINVLNYFNTFGQRGADNQEDFDVQEAKLVAAIVEMNVDILAIQEIENDGFGANSSIQDLVDAINAVAGAGVYDFVSHTSGAVGDDAIAVGLLYKTTTVSEAGTSALLATGNFSGSSTNRSPLAQTFTHIASGETITAVAVHMKSKGGSGSGADADNNDGAGNFNDMRLNGVIDTRNWIENTDPTGVNSDNIIILGDYNAYAMEDPITNMTSNGYSNLFPDPTEYSFVFGNQWGSLDYALANADLAAKVVGAEKFHINADEPRSLSYSSEFDDASLRDNSFYRASDHDPLIIGINMGSTPVTNSLSAIATCNGISTNDNFNIVVTGLTSGTQYAVDTDGDGTVDQIFTASTTVETLSSSFTFVDGTETITVSIDEGYDGTTFSADNTIEVHEIKCIDIDTDGSIDNNIALCDNTAVAGVQGVIMAQAAPYTGTNVYVYVLVDASDAIVMANTAGYFDGLSNQEYTMHAYNVPLSDVADMLGAFSAGTSFSSATIPSTITCYTHCTSSNAPRFTVACNQCPVIAGVSIPSNVCEGSSFDIAVAEAENLSTVMNGDDDFGLNFIYWTGIAPMDVYDGSQDGVLGSMAFANMTLTGSQYSGNLSGVGSSLTEGTYTICGILDATPSDASCRPSNCVTVIIEAKPTVSIPNSGRDAICSSATTYSLNANAANGGNMTWTTSNGAGAITGNNYTIDMADIDNSPLLFTVTVDGTGACSSEQASAMLELIINATSCGTFPWNGN